MNMGFNSFIRHLIPRGVWLRRAALLFGFIFLDFLVTAILCRTPYAEANLYARSFMQRYGIVLGLALFDLLLALPIYGILVVDWHLIKYTQQYAGKAEAMVDISLGWLIAGAHFNGAMSWLWDAPHIIRQTLGFAAYMALAILFLYRLPKGYGRREIFGLRADGKNEDSELSMRGR
jgi:hypothetical protein